MKRVRLRLWIGVMGLLEVCRAQETAVYLWAVRRAMRANTWGWSQ